MRESRRSALLGVLHTIALAMFFAAGSQSWTDGVFVFDEWKDILISMAVWSLPAGTALAIGFGSLGKRLAKTTRVLRYCAYVGFAVVTMTVATPFWIDLAPWTIVPTIGYAIAFEHWLVRPHLAALSPRRPFALISRDPLYAALEKGAVLGASTAIAIAIDYARVPHYRDCGLLHCPVFVDADPTGTQMFVAVAIHTLPVGILWGMLVGYVAHTSVDPIGRWLAVLALAFVGICVFSIAWPNLIAHAIAIGIVHTTVLLSWTRRRPEFPIARPIGRLRSTCYRGARSRDPTPTRSDTSRTTRSA